LAAVESSDRANPTNNRTTKGAKVSELSKVRLHQLFQLAQHLLIAEPHIADGSELLPPFKGMFGITGMCLFDAGTETSYRAGSAAGELESATRSACLTGKDTDDPGSGVTVRVLRAGSRITGAIAFKGLKDPEQTAEPLISLVAALHERTRLRRKLGDEFKNGLTSILAAAGGLREAGPLSAVQLEMTRIVEEEASRLGSLISSVDRIGRLDQGEIHPRVDATNLTALVAQAVEQCSKRLPERRIVFQNDGEAFQVLADAELILVALGQVLDYVCRHAGRNSSVLVEIVVRRAFVVVGVSGTVDPRLPPDRERVFERPYRGARARSFSAEARSGLYQAREIALAHGGTLDFDPERPGPERIAFLLSLPRANGQPRE
jgi:signal transduction histidine kinase